MRVDQLLVQRGLASSRTHAQRLIESGRVRVGSLPARKPSEQVGEHTELAVAPDAADRFVSRGGLKLQGALDRSGIDPAGLVCLDVGQSTGGFTDYLLQAGAARVVGVDVGHSQLHERLRHDPRVVTLEHVNARSLTRSNLGEHFPARDPCGGFGLIVVDVSFISLELVLPALAPLGGAGGALLALVKPQFEVGRNKLDDRGLVREAALYPGVLEAVSQVARAGGWHVEQCFESAIRGGDGNREFFLQAHR